MPDDSSRVGVVDVVWSAGCDGQWRTVAHIAGEVPFKSEEVEAALDLLVRYGFAESCVLGEKWFRVIVDSPSPMEAAEVLQLVGLPAH